MVARLPRASPTFPRRAGAPGRPSTTSTRARTASSCASAPACSRASPTARPGAIVAAPTTSLPETVGGERNWDYRFSWIRDSSLTLEALYIGACPDEAEDFVSFMTSAAGGRAERGLAPDHVRDRRRARPLRARAPAPARLARLAPGARRQRRLGPDAARRLRRAAQRAPPLPRAARRPPPGDPGVRRRPRRRRGARAGARPTPGMWEMRGEPRHHLSSKVLCWTALDRAVKLAPQLGEYAQDRGVGGGARRDPRGDPRARLERERARRTRSRSTPTSSTPPQLLMPILGFLPADRRADALDDRGDRRAT